MCEINNLMIQKSHRQISFFLFILTFTYIYIYIIFNYIKTSPLFISLHMHWVHSFRLAINFSVNQRWTVCACAYVWLNACIFFSSLVYFEPSWNRNFAHTFQFFSVSENVFMPFKIKFCFMMMFLWGIAIVKSVYCI